MKNQKILLPYYLLFQIENNTHFANWLVKFCLKNMFEWILQTDKKILQIHPSKGIIKISLQNFQIQVTIPLTGVTKKKRSKR